MNLESKLHKIQRLLIELFPSLSSQLVSEDELFLHLWNYSPGGLRYLPNFHLIIEPFEDVFQTKLLSYHGKTLESKTIHGIENDAADNFLPPELIQFVHDYFQEQDKICTGVEDIRDISQNNETLSDFLNDDIITKSANCQFKVGPNEHICAECQKLVKVVDIKHDFLRIKLEDIKTEDQEEEEPEHSGQLRTCF